MTPADVFVFACAFQVKGGFLRYFRLLSMHQNVLGDFERHTLFGKKWQLIMNLLCCGFGHDFVSFSQKAEASNSTIPFNSSIHTGEGYGLIETVVG